MQMVSTPTQVLKHWSLWIMTLLGVFDGLHAALPAIQLAVTPQVFNYVNLTAIVGALITKFVKQNLDGMSPDPVPEQPLEPPKENP